MSLTSLRADLGGQRLHLRHPTEGTPLFRDPGEGVDFSKLTDAEKQALAVTITLLGKDSDIYKSAQRRAQAAFRETIQAGQKWLPADDERMAEQQLVDCTVGWGNVPAGWVDLTDNEAPIDFTKERARALFRNGEYGWVKDQVSRFIEDRANFVKASSET